LANARSPGSPPTGAARPRRSSSVPSGAAGSCGGSWTGPSTATWRLHPATPGAGGLPHLRGRLRAGAPARRPPAAPGRTWDRQDAPACAILAQVIQAGHTGLFLSRLRGTADLPRRLLTARATLGDRGLALLTPRPARARRGGVAIGHASTRRAMLFDVLNDRYAEMRPTILIGNLTATELETYLGERILDRLRELGSVTVPFAWPSHRRWLSLRTTRRTAGRNPRLPPRRARGDCIPQKSATFRHLSRRPGG
jgi:DNA replication protein DnaC